MKVLIVDDEPLLLEIWVNMFSDLGWHVTTAPNGNAGRECLEAKDYDIVITDIRMPEGDGFVVLNSIREKSGVPPITYVSSGYIDEEQVVLESYAIERIIRKPFSFGEEQSYFREKFL